MTGSKCNLNLFMLIWSSCWIGLWIVDFTSRQDEQTDVGDHHHHLNPNKGKQNLPHLLTMKYINKPPYTETLDETICCS